MTTVGLTVHWHLLPGRTFTATADVKSTWMEFLTRNCGVEVPYPEGYQVQSLSYGRAGKKGWKAELDDIIETCIAQFSVRKSQYSVRVCRKTSRGSLGGQPVIGNDSVPNIEPDPLSIDDLLAPPPPPPTVNRVAPRRVSNPATEPQKIPVDRQRLRFSHPTRTPPQFPVGTPWKLKIKQRLANVGNPMLLKVADEIKSLNDNGLWQRNVMHAPLASTFLMDLLGN